jgi:histidinol-phosphate aminotransferase
MPEPVDLSHNVNPHPAEACLAAARYLTEADLYDYAPSFRSGGRSDLGDKLAEDCKVEPEQIVIGYGAEDILKQALAHFVRPGEVVALPSARWRYYREMLDEIRGVAVDYPVVPDGLTYRVDVDALLELASTHRVRLLLLASPGNPTGDLFPMDRLEEVLLAYRDSVVVVDEAYFGCGDMRPDPAVLAALTRLYPNLMIIRTFSKRYALAGWRSGYAVIGAGLADFARVMRRYLGHSYPAERVVLAALRSEAHYERIREGFADARERLYRVLDPYEEATAYRSQGNFVLVRFSEARVPFVRTHVAGAGLKFKWFVGEPAFEHCARITLGTAEQNRRVRVALAEGMTISRFPPTLRKANYLAPYLLPDKA